MDNFPQSKKSWQARHTGVKITQQIAILLGCAVLPHLKSLVEIIEHGLTDENQKVRTITALSVAALAEAAAAGIEHLLPGGERSDDDAPNPPYAIFGHSMGAWIAFEMTRAIERRRSARGGGGGDGGDDGGGETASHTTPFAW